jgi:hypothetical protein
MMAWRKKLTAKPSKTAPNDGLTADGRSGPAMTTAKPAKMAQNDGLTEELDCQAVKNGPK